MKFKNKSFQIILLIIFFMMCSNITLQASTGNNAVFTASNEIRRYVNNLSVLVRSIGGIVGIVGAIKVYKLWALGNREYYKVFYSWAWAIVFLHFMPNFLGAIIYGSWDIGNIQDRDDQIKLPDFPGTVEPPKNGGINPPGIDPDIEKPQPIDNDIILIP